MKFTLAQITSFIAVAENLHFGQAAEELNMTQPPLSRQIQKLEKSIGVQLFERNNRNVTLTPAGETFLAEAYGLVASVNRAPRRAQKVAEGSWGQITIGCTAVSSFGVLGDLLSRIADRLPGVSVEISEMVTAEEVKALGDGLIDIGLGRPDRVPATVETALVQSERLVAAVPIDHAFAHRDSLRSSEISGQNLIMHSPTKARYFYDLTVRYIDVGSNEITHSLSQILTIVNLVAAGRGIAVVSESAAHLRLDGVVYVPLVDVPDGAVELHAIWNPDSRNPALRKVIELVREFSD
ncbi:LysR family transcriptional regulator [Brevibacterium sp. SMBL_HHYL_HB1]|jgi:DNA-binding transcriptional LysR family regulator|uniref:LysR family transcriptional regulator n=1 Tax=Brevibacterium sp. SMBL_HHYL_HB1 TaxID=2777556 RepID=UPI001BA9CAB9|nr:LysR family transcriptional regulator [Brevibacterium sp. SMBL_HHYL_HB1]QUL78786.1 LysR family transcriptional regulator [Brevibacterium sp. SMBL_HHYL_HB1]